MTDLVKRYWWVGVVAVLVGMSTVHGSPKQDPAAQAYAGGALSWCAACQSATVPSVPEPAPEGGECENCSGRGKVGDGVIMRTCPVCKGTGKSSSDVPDDEAEEQAEETQPIAIEQPQESFGECADGSCSSGSGRRGLFGGFFRRR